MSTLGPSWRSLFYAKAPSLFRCLPEASRLRIVATHLGPAGGWFMKDRFMQVPHLLGYRVKQADSSSDGRVHLQLIANDGRERVLRPEHIIAATGYRVDLDRLPFLSSDVRSQLKSVNNNPVLSATFESSLPGLFFVGAIAANSFGPVMRFAAGANFAARRISSHLAGRGSTADDSETVLTSEAAV
jgi:lysine/ornithine N-monooxygenase